MRRRRLVARHLGDVVAHEHQQAVERVAAGGEERAAAAVAPQVPLVLADLGPDVVVVVDLGVVHRADQIAVDEALGHRELLAEAHLEAHAGADAGGRARRPRRRACSSRSRPIGFSMIRCLPACAAAIACAACRLLRLQMSITSMSGRAIRSAKSRTTSSGRPSRPAELAADRDRAGGADRDDLAAVDQAVRAEVRSRGPSRTDQADSPIASCRSSPRDVQGADLARRRAPGRRSGSRRSRRRSGRPRPRRSRSGGGGRRSIR